MRDFFMGAEVELEELALGASAPDTTPPQGVLMSHLESDGWIRKYVYKASRGVLGRSDSKLLVGEIPPEPGFQMEGARESSPEAERSVRLSKPVRVNVPMMGSAYGPQIQLNMGVQTKIRQTPHVPTDTRLNLPPGASIPLSRQGPFLGQVPTASQVPPPAAPLPPPAGSPEAVPAPLPSGPDCNRPLQLPDGTVLNPDDTLTLKDFCAMIPYLQKLMGKEAGVSPDNGPIRPGGPIPLSAGVPSFGPAGGPFAQGGFGGGGGGGGTPGAGPIGVVNGATPVGGPNQGTQGPPGPVGPAGAPGAGNIVDGAQKTDGNFQNIGAMMPIPGLSGLFTIGADGKALISFNFILSADFPGDSIYDVFAGIRIDATQYQLWQNGEQQGAGGDKVFTTTAFGTILVTGLTPGDHTISVVYGDNPALNHFSVVTSPSEPANLVVQHS